MANGQHEPPLVNVGWGEDVSIRELAATIANVVGFKGTIAFGGLGWIYLALDKFSRQKKRVRAPEPGAALLPAGT